jgi:hypothetical protein
MQCSSRGSQQECWAVQAVPCCPPLPPPSLQQRGRYWQVALLHCGTLLQTGAQLGWSVPMRDGTGVWCQVIERQAALHWGAAGVYRVSPGCEGLHQARAFRGVGGGQVFICGRWQGQSTLLLPLPPPHQTSATAPRAQSPSTVQQFLYAHCSAVVCISGQHMLGMHWGVTGAVSSHA